MGDDPINTIDPSGGVSWPVMSFTTGLSTTAAKAITLGEVIVKSVSHATSAVSAVSTALKIASITAKVCLVADIINTTITTLQTGDIAFENPDDPPLKISQYSYSALEDGWKSRRNGQKIIKQEKTLADLEGQTPVRLDFLMRQMMLDIRFLKE